MQRTSLLVDSGSPKGADGSGVGGAGGREPRAGGGRKTEAARAAPPGGGDDRGMRRARPKRTGLLASQEACLMPRFSRSASSMERIVC